MQEKCFMNHFRTHTTYFFDMCLNWLEMENEAMISGEIILEEAFDLTFDFTFEHAHHRAQLDVNGDGLAVHGDRALDAGAVVVHRVAGPIVLAAEPLLESARDLIDADPCGFRGHGVILLNMDVRHTSAASTNVPRT